MLARRVQVDAVQGDAPLEGHCQQQVLQRLQQILPLPRLVAGHPHHAEPEVVVHAQHIAEHVMAVVVRVPPLRRDRDHVPLPRAGVDLRVVHPIPLAVGHVVTDLHVLDALRERQRGRAQDPARLRSGAGDEQPRRDVEGPLE